MITNGTFDITTEAQKLFDVGAANAVLVIANPLGNPTIYWGGAGVTVDNGIPIAAGDAPAVIETVDADDDLYFVAASGCTARFAKRSRS